MTVRYDSCLHDVPVDEDCAACEPGRPFSAGGLGVCNGVDSCEHGRAWNAACERCASGRLSELVSLWGRDTAAAASCRRSVRMVWPELGERLDDLLDQQDGGDQS